MSGRSIGASIGCAIALGLMPTPAAAQPTSNDFAIDLFQGPAFGSTRTLSMGGAYGGYAQGIEGYTHNPASPAVRHPYSLSWWDQDIDGSVSFPITLFENNDFDNSGDLDADYTNFIYLAGGMQLQGGPFGIGAFGDLQRYTLTFPQGDGDQDTVVLVGRYHVLGGWGFFNHQLNFGAGVRALTIGLSSPDTELTLFGAAPEFGVVLRPNWTPFRIGAAYRHQVKSQVAVGSGLNQDASGVERAGNLVLPREAVLPWEVQVGTAIQVGSRPLNPAWINPHDHEDELREAYHRRRQNRLRRIDHDVASLPAGAARDELKNRLLAEEAARQRREAGQMTRDLDRLLEERRAYAKNWPRDALLLTVDLLVTGPVSGGLSLERFLAQGQTGDETGDCQVVQSGSEVNFSPRFGVEVEPLPQYVHARAGSYYEPNRFTYRPERCNDRVGRQHFTFGVDVKLASTTWFGLVPEVTYKLQGVGDVAPRYQSFGLGFGIWH